MGEWRYSLCTFLSSVLDGGEWSALPPGKDPPPPRYSLNEWLGGPHSRSGCDGEEKRIHCWTSTLRTRSEMVFETLVCSPLSHLTRLIARENFIIEKNPLTAKNIRK
jgi:hypothetical protein